MGEAGLLQAKRLTAGASADFQAGQLKHKEASLISTPAGHARMLVRA
jgi:hypothetical protein